MNKLLFAPLGLSLLCNAAPSPAQESPVTPIGARCRIAQRWARTGGSAASARREPGSSAARSCGAMGIHQPIRLALDAVRPSVHLRVPR